MPFYAVAVGKIPGVYATWPECQSQTKGYPQAKFRKFNTQAEALDFVKSKGSQNNENTTTRPSMITKITPPEVEIVNKYGSKALLKQDKLGLIAEKLDKFIDETNKKLSEFSEKLESLETLFLSENTTEGKRKAPNDDAQLEKERKATKKKKSNNQSVEISDEEETNTTSIASIRSKSTLTNGSIDQSDGNNSSQGFVITPDGFVIVYTDGACSNNGRNNARAGLGVWFNHNNPFNVAAPVDGVATNNNAEIQAATRAIGQAQLAGIQKLDIHTDSQFMINCVTDWMKKWKKNNWLTSNGGPVKNKEQLQILDNAIKSLEAVRWTHVRGHAGNEGNEAADFLARTGASQTA